ncbi:FliM/FliN family flagellar motor switch protein [Vitreimonas flagellata]|uniref:FliM/FliN family flagellar motor switch protein n=1 Tax=Vitreimonas flagellata TaxID=2560861 RepID=UPI0010753E4E|nr:FliM/FliN family flagellar motor switch protein [Vitreimonas flagellata]
MSLARTWLPANALVDGALNAHLRAIVEAWVEDWMPSPRRVELRQYRGEHFPGMSSQAHSWEADEMALILDPRAPIGVWLLGFNTSPQRPNEADSKLMAALSTSAALDLFARLHAAFGLEGAPRTNQFKRPDDDALVFSVGLGTATNLLYLCLSRQRALAARKRLAGPATPPARGTHPITQALMRQDIRVGAMLGCAHLAISDVRSLGLGDVVVLDRGDADDLDLTINGAIVAASCDLAAEGDQTVLRLRLPLQTSEDVHS